MNEQLEFTEEQLRVTLETLKILKEQDPEHDPELYTTDYIVDQMIRYFDSLRFRMKQPLSPRQAYARAMSIVEQK